MATAKKKENTEIKKDGKNEAIDAITDQINKKYGPGSFMRLGSNKTVNVDVISTGSFNFRPCAWSWRNTERKNNGNIRT